MQETSTHRPFEGLRIVDLGSFWAAPYLTEYLGAYGADVIKVESIQRPDGFRFSATSPVLGKDWHERSLLWQAANLDKRGITLALDTPRGKELLTRLIATADIFVENYAARVVERFGFDAEDILAINPHAIVLRLPGFGLEGPWRDFVGWGNAFEQLAGQAWITGLPDGRPSTPGGYIDPTVGMHAAVALLAALEHRDATGEGQLVEVAQIEVGAGMNAEQVIYHQLFGRVQQRTGNVEARYVAQGTFATVDEENIALSVRTPEEARILLAAVTDTHPDLAKPDGGDDIDAVLSSWIAGQTADSALGVLRSAGVPAAIVIKPLRFNSDEQLSARGYYQEVRHPLTDTNMYPTYPFKFSFQGDDPVHRRAAPTLGQHNAEVLAEVGVSPEVLRELEADGVIGTFPLGS